MRKVLPLVQTADRKNTAWNFSASAADWASFTTRRSPAAGRPGGKLPPAKDILTPHKYAARLVPLLQPLGLQILHRAGPVYFRQRRHSGHAGRICEAHRPEKFSDRGCRDERLDPPGVLRRLPRNRAAHHKGGALVKSDVVGPICESGDYFCKDRPLPKVGEGDYLALLSAGAYSSAMASNYNTRPLAAEILVNGKKIAVVRERQAVEEIWADEKIAPWLK